METISVLCFLALLQLHCYEMHCAAYFLELSSLQGVPPQGLIHPPPPSAHEIAFATRVLGSAIILVSGAALAARDIRAKWLELAVDFCTGDGDFKQQDKEQRKDRVTTSLHDHLITHTPLLHRSTVCAWPRSCRHDKTIQSECPGLHLLFQCSCKLSFEVLGGKRKKKRKTTWAEESLPTSIKEKETRRFKRAVIPPNHKTGKWKEVSSFLGAFSGTFDPSLIFVMVSIGSNL
eukprot:46545-Pelagomonas_calceolata.AAC.5